jgi:RND family efflux transporter MFP subunit
VVLGVLAVTAAAAVLVLAVVLLWPKQAGRPVQAPRSVTFEASAERPSAEQTLRLTDEQAKAAQFQIEVVGERLSAQGTAQMTTGVVQADSYKETPVVSLVGGIVRSIGAELGQNVKRGQRIAVVFSNELAEAQTKYLSGMAALDEHHRHHMRTMKLVEIGAASRQDLDTSNSEYREAESNVENLRQKLLLLGMTSQQIDSLNSSSQVSSAFTMTSPASGTVTSRTANPGEVIEANKELMRVTDLSTVWVVGQVHEKDLATVRVGSGANISSDAYPGRVFRARVSYVDPKIDQATRTAQVRIELSNPNQMFKIGMFVNVAFAGLGVSENTTPVVRKDAVQTIGNQQFVFMPTSKPTEFIMRAVRTGAQSDDVYQVLEGLNTGDRVVTSGSFLLRAEWAKQHPTQ